MRVAADERSPASDTAWVWDGVVRLLHWLLAGLVVFDLVHDDGGALHRLIGYGAAAAVAARLLWAARAAGANGFDALEVSPRATLAYLQARAPRTHAHDPLGLWMVWLLWILVLLLGVTGWLSRLDAFWGDERLHDLHAWFADILIGAAGLHVLGVAAMSWRWRENLVAAMLTGRKRRDDRNR